MRTTSLLPIFLIVITLGARCTSQPRLSEDHVFEFSSGGAHHPQGFAQIVSWKSSSCGMLRSCLVSQRLQAQVRSKRLQADNGKGTCAEMH
jgi:hypothetical protein